MWALDNQTPYSAGRNWTRDKDGLHHWIVAVQATFDIALSGKLSLADVQPPPRLAPAYHGDPGRSSLKFDSDLLGVKPCTDVALDAHAHAPRGKPASSVEVSLRVASLHKQLVVYGDRVYYRAAGGGLTTSSPQPFLTRPIRYEHAYGGADTSDKDPTRHAREPRNPIGAGFTLDPARLVHERAPSIEYTRGAAEKNPPASFGPIDCAWSPRLERAGTYDAKWERTRRPLLAADYDDLYVSSAPDDQRFRQHLRGGEPVELLRMTPEGTLRFELPKIYLSFTTSFGSRAEQHRARMTSVNIEPERRQVAVIWQSSLAVEARDEDYLDQTTIEEKPYLT
jgi:hypothetical protein